MSNIVRLPVTNTAEFEERDYTEDYLLELDRLNFEIANMVTRRKNLINDIIQGLQLVTFNEKGAISSVKHDGQVTQEIGRFNATFITKSSFSIDSKKYEELEHLIPEDINPVKVSVSYRMSNTSRDNFLDNSTLEQQNTLSKCMTMKYSADIKLAPRKR